MNINQLIFPLEEVDSLFLNFTIGETLKVSSVQHCVRYSVKFVLKTYYTIGFYKGIVSPLNCEAYIARVIQPDTHGSVVPSVCSFWVCSLALSSLLK